MGRSVYTLGLLLLVQVGAGCAAQVQQEAPPNELVDNPVYQEWARFKVGSAVTYQLRIGPSGKPDQEISVTQKSELVELSPSQAVVRMSASTKLLLLPVPVLDQRETYPARIKKPANTAQTQPASTEVVDEGTETVEAAGKKFACNRVRVEVGQAGKIFKTRSWVCPEVPGGVVKLEVTMAGPAGPALETRMLLTGLHVVP